MPLNVYDAPTTAAHLSNLDPELAYLLDELEISEQIQANLAAREIKKVGVFAKVEPNEDAFRAWLKADLGLDPSADVVARVTVAKLAEAWEAARQRAVTVRKIEAESRVTGQAREMMKGVHLALRRACARTHGPVEDRRCPGRAYLESRLEQLDDGELEAEPLSKVTTVAIEQESVATSAGAGVDIRRDGLLHVVKGKRTAPLPTNPEQFRAVMQVMGLHWEMVHLKGAGRAILRDYSTLVFQNHVNYILGDECLLIAEANPTMAYGPSWDLLMKYEFEIRRRAVRKVNEGGATLAEAMLEARQAMDHRTSYFITPLAMPSSRARVASGGEPRGDKRSAADAFAHPEEEQPSGSRRKSDKGKSKGKDKGKKSGKATTTEQLKQMPDKAAYRLVRGSPFKYGISFKAPDGTPRCHNFQSSSCTMSGCKFVHTCMRCGGAHGVLRCPDLGLAGR